MIKRILIGAFLFSSMLWVAHGDELPTYSTNDSGLSQNLNQISYQADQHRHLGTDGSTALGSNDATTGYILVGQGVGIPPIWQATFGTYGSSTSASTLLPATGNYGDLVFTLLSTGTWLMTGVGQFTLPGSTWTNDLLGISTTTGNSSTGLVEGDTAMRPGWTAAATPTQVDIEVPNVILTLAASATAYLKMRGTFGGTGANTPTVVGRLSWSKISN